MNIVTLVVYGRFFFLLGYVVLFTRLFRDRCKNWLYHLMDTLFILWIAVSICYWGHFPVELRKEAADFLGISGLFIFPAICYVTGLFFPFKRQTVPGSMLSEVTRDMNDDEAKKFNQSKSSVDPLAERKYVPPPVSMIDRRNTAGFYFFGYCMLCRVIFNV